MGAINLKLPGKTINEDISFKLPGKSYEIKPFKVKNREFNIIIESRGTEKKLYIQSKNSIWKIDAIYVIPSLEDSKMKNYRDIYFCQITPEVKGVNTPPTKNVTAFKLTNIKLFSEDFEALNNDILMKTRSRAGEYDIAYHSFSTRDKVTIYPKGAQKTTLDYAPAKPLEPEEDKKIPLIDRSIIEKEPEQRNKIDPDKVLKKKNLPAVVSEKKNLPAIIQENKDKDEDSVIVVNPDDITDPAKEIIVSRKKPLEDISQYVTSERGQQEIVSIEGETFQDDRTPIAEVQPVIFMGGNVEELQEVKEDEVNQKPQVETLGPIGSGEKERLSNNGIASQANNKIASQKTEKKKEKKKRSWAKFLALITMGLIGLGFLTAFVVTLFNPFVSLLPSLTFFGLGLSALGATAGVSANIIKEKSDAQIKKKKNQLKKAKNAELERDKAKDMPYDKSFDERKDDLKNLINENETLEENLNRPVDQSSHIIESDPIQQSSNTQTPTVHELPKQPVNELISPLPIQSKNNKNGEERNQ